MTVSKSTDRGLTWNEHKLIYAENADYSALVPLASGLGLLFDYGKPGQPQIGVGFTIVEYF